MFINEYGDKNNPLFLLLAPMMVSGEDLYQLMRKDSWRNNRSAARVFKEDRRWDCLKTM